MSITGIPIMHSPSALEQYKTLIRHVHAGAGDDPESDANCFSEPEPEGVHRKLRDWLENRYQL